MADWKLSDPITRDDKIAELMQRYAPDRIFIGNDTLQLITHRLVGRWKPAPNVTRSGDAKKIEDLHIAIKKLRDLLPLPPSVHGNVMRDLDDKRGGRVTNTRRYVDLHGEEQEGKDIIPRLINLTADLEALEQITSDPEELLANKVRTQKNAQALQAVHAGVYAYYKATKQKPMTKNLAGEFERFLEEFFDVVFAENHDPQHAYKGWVELGGLDWFDKITVRLE